MTALKPVLVSAPAELPVTLAELKAHCRVDHDDDDATLARYLAEATAYLDGWRGVLGVALVTQTWRADFDGFPCGETLRLPFGPVASITSITYRDLEDAGQTLATSVYAGPFEDDRSPFLRLKSGQAWPATYDRADAVAVTFVAGVAKENIPADLREAVAKLAAHAYENREPVVLGQTVRELPLSVQAVIDARRVRL